MQKTRLGITVGLFGAALYLVSYFGGYVIGVLLAAYVLLFEENVWLKRAAVKSIALLVGFSLLNAVIGLIPSAIGLVDSIFNVFEESFTLYPVTRIITVITSALSIIRTVLFIMLGIKALGQGTVNVPVIDKLLAKYITD